MNTTPIRPSVLTIAGMDSSGLAGFGADIRTQDALGVHSLAVMSANTTQTNATCKALNPVDPEVFAEQLKNNVSLPFSAIKIGLLAEVHQIETLTELLPAKYPVVWDPVITTSSGKNVLSKTALTRLHHTLFEKVSLLTPNLPELETLSAQKVSSHDEVIKAAHSLLKSGLEAVYVKGGHRDGEWVQDYFSDGKRSFWLSSRRIETHNTRGTGCIFSSAVASALALGYSMYDAVVIGKMTINQGLRQSYALDVHEKGSLYIGGFPSKPVDLPYLTRSADFPFENCVFPRCDSPEILGLYPIVDSADWLERILPQGVTTAQLRIKKLEGEALENEIKRGIHLGKQYNCRVFINDYWPLAIKHNAYGVHLGQEDLDDADIQAIHAAGLYLGISTHCHYEVARAHALRPSYIACGPVFHTNTKQMPWVPHGYDGFKYWRKTLDYPLVAIGGITKERLPKVVEQGADGVAMITAITEAGTPEKTTRDFLRVFKS